MIQIRCDKCNQGWIVYPTIKNKQTCICGNEIDYSNEVKK